MALKFVSLMVANSPRRRRQRVFVSCPWWNPRSIASNVQWTPLIGRWQHERPWLSSTGLDSVQ